MKEIEIGEFFKEKLSGSVQAPPAGAWDGILQDPTLQRFNRTRRLRRLALRVGLPMLAVVVALVAFLLVPSSVDSSSTSSQISATSCKSTLSPAEAATSVVAPATIRTTVSTTLPASTVSPDEVVAFAEIDKSMSLPTAKTVVTSEAAPALPLMVTLPHHEPANSILIPSISTNSSSSKSIPDNSFKQVAGGDLDTNEQLSNALSFSHDTSVCRNSKIKLYVHNADNVFWSCGSQMAEVELYVSEPLTIRADIRTVDKRDTAIFVRIGVYDCELFIPSAFTPNGDGLNDEWLVSAPADYSHYECVVKDKSGRILFQTKNIHQGWDGRSNGQYLPLGAYHYICRFRDEMGEQHIQQGQVMIIR